tara:strand:- start:731 stop:1633 length:903 start_codon:yes stop_codon:yes gene_type:complete
MIDTSTIIIILSVIFSLSLLFLLVNKKKEGLSNINGAQSLCLMTRFKNERHILYEFIHHYLLEGVDYFLLIDDGSDDEFYALNEYWLKPLIESKTVRIITSTTTQEQEYNLHNDDISRYDWVIVCDMDEFFFSVPKNSTIKQLLNSNLSEYDYISIPWKLFHHHSKFQPKSVIENNAYTHESKIDPSSPSKGYKYMVRSKVIEKFGIHSCTVKQKANVLRLYDAHNNIIQNNHYRAQSDEFLYGVKKPRGGGKNKKKYKNYTIDTSKFNKPCSLLRDKREGLIQECMDRKQIKPKTSFQN